MARSELAAADVWQRLELARSFAFSLRYHTDIPVDIGCVYTGRWQSPDREQWAGRYVRSGEVSAVSLLAAGDYQYEMTAGGWRKLARGVETRVIDQTRQALHGAVLEPAGEERGRYLFRFVPRATILDPTQSSVLEGRLEVDSRTGFPLKIACSDESGRLYWEMRFSHFNRAGTVRVPFVPDQILSVLPGRRLRLGGWRRTVGVLRGRLGRLGIDFRMRRVREGLELKLSPGLIPSQLELLLSVGRVELWEAEWAGQDAVRGDGRMVVVAGDAARPAQLHRLAAANGQLAAGVAKALPTSPELVVRSGGRREGGLFVLMVDSVAVGAAWADSGGVLSFADLGSGPVVDVLAAVANGPALPTQLRAELQR